MRSIIILFLLFSICISSERINIVTFEYSGIMINDADMKENGILLDIVKEALHTQGIEVNFIFYPLKRAKFLFLNSDYQIFAGSSVQFTENNNLVEYIDFDYSNFYFFYYHKNIDTMTYQEIMDKKYTVGIILGSSLEKILMDKGINYENAPNQKSLLLKLIYGRNDVVTGGEYFVKHLIASEFYNNSEYFKMVKQPISSLPLSLMFKRSEKNDEFISIFLKGIDEIKENGSYERIKQKYLF